MKHVGPEYYLEDARNVVWAIGFLNAIYLLGLSIYAMSEYGTIKLDLVNIFIILYLVVLSILSFYAGIMCRRGKKVGHILGNTIGIIAFFNFPLGTLFSVATFIKLNKAAFVNQLK